MLREMDFVPMLGKLPFTSKAPVLNESLGSSRSAEEGSIIDQNMNS